MWKYRLTKAGWVLNALFNASGLARVPLIGPMWSNGKRLIARWISSGQGVPVQLGGEQIFIHPFTIAYDINRWEPYTIELFQNALKPGFTVLDIGAHHGYFSLLAARRVGEHGKIYAFEPALRNFEILKKNVELNRFANVITVNRAVSDRCATMPFFLRQSTSVVGSLFPTGKQSEINVPVKCITVDAFLNGSHVDVVKMDIEGSEPFALEGMKETLAKSKDVVLVVEINPDCLSQGGVEPDDFLSRLRDAGFECQIIDEDGRRLKPIHGDPGFCNLYCVKTAVAA
jgi:FkbM family methyltransferase